MGGRLRFDSLAGETLHVETASTRGNRDPTTNSKPDAEEISEGTLSLFNFNNFPI